MRLTKAKNTNTVVLQGYQRTQDVERCAISTTNAPARIVPGNITYVDYEKLYGTSPETILGKHVQELMGASDYQKVQGYVEAVWEKVTYELTRTFKMARSVILSLIMFRISAKQEKF